MPTDDGENKFGTHLNLNNSQFMWGRKKKKDIESNKYPILLSSHVNTEHLFPFLCNSMWQYKKGDGNCHELSIWYYTRGREKLIALENWQQTWS